MRAFFDTPIEYLKGVGPQRAILLNKELKIFTYGDLIQYYPFRYEDRTKFYLIQEISEDQTFIQLKGRIRRKELTGTGNKRRLVAHFSDETGEVDLIWFQGINWADEKLKTGVEYIAFGKPVRYGNRYSLAHPDLEPVTEKNEKKGTLHPVYPLTEKLRTRHLDSKFLSKLVHELLMLSTDKMRETLPLRLLNENKFLSKKESLINIHFPENQQALVQAQARLKFEELFYIQFRLLKMKLVRKDKFKGQIFNDTSLLTKFYNDYLPFSLTQAQKKVIKEIYADLKSGKQMNRLLQGDVGSGKTIVGFICMLIAIGSKAQCALMAPTEILAQQHFKTLQKYAASMELSVSRLTGSTKKSERKAIHEQLRNGTLNILVGTHALLEDKVQFQNLGLAIIDEQHRFGVAQRSKLWQKSNDDTYPHVLVMTATPIPRTLAMTLYGDLDVSVIDELPAGRKPIKTIHRFDAHRLQVNQFLRDQIQAGRQIYIVYPLIDESEKLDLKHLMDGYESICRAFPDTPVSIVHGKM